MLGLGASELFLVLLIALVFFGPGRLPEIGSALGRAISGFRGAVTERPVTERPALPPE